MTGAVALGAAAGFSTMGSATRQKIECLGSRLVGEGDHCKGSEADGSSVKSLQSKVPAPGADEAGMSSAYDPLAHSGLEGVNTNTFATTFALNDNHACGYPKALLDRVAPDQFFVALSGETYNPAYCGRTVKIKTKGCCASASKIDEGQCIHDSGSSVKTEFTAILVDRCPDPKKCVSPSMSENVRAHLDLAPQDKAKKELAQCGNYDIDWSFVNEGSKTPPVAFAVHKPDDQYYFRLGLWLPYGAEHVEIMNNGTWQPATVNGLQSQYTVNVGKPSSELLGGGMTIRVSDFSGSGPKCYQVKSKGGSGGSVFYKSEGGENYYDVNITPLSKCP